MTVEHPRSVASLQHRAAADLAAIRRTMDRAGRFTAVSGRGGIAMGVVALLAAATSPGLAAGTTWLAWWLAAAGAASCIAAASMHRKARRSGAGVLDRDAGRRFVFGLAPPLVAGAILTAAIASVGHLELLPGSWLLLYGTAVVCGGMGSVLAVRVMGVAFVALSLLAFAAPAVHADALLAVGFGGLHLSFGLWIARHHGG